MQFNARKKQISLKVVYYGPGLSGKTTNLTQLHRLMPSSRTGKLLQLDTDTERTLFFDYFPLHLGKLNSYLIKLNLYTVPGQSFYQQTRQTVLEGADGIVFVADSSPKREEANRISLTDMKQSLALQERALSDIPLVFQWNKRDLKSVLSVRVLERQLNPEKRPSFEAMALQGKGVIETQNALIQAMLYHIRKQQRQRLRA